MVIYENLLNLPIQKQLGYFKDYIKLIFRAVNSEKFCCFSLFLKRINITVRLVKNSNIQQIINFIRWKF